MIHEDKQLQYYLDFPFEFHEQIVEFASSGIISKKEFSDYLDLREAFRKHINIRIMSFDREELPNSTKNEFLETYERVTSVKRMPNLSKISPPQMSMSRKTFRKL